MQALPAAVPPLSERVTLLRAALADPEAREAERALRKNIDARNAEAGALNLGPLIQRATAVGGPSGAGGGEPQRTRGAATRHGRGRTTGSSRAVRTRCASAIEASYGTRTAESRALCGASAL